MGQEGLAGQKESLPPRVVRHFRGSAPARGDRFRPPGKEIRHLPTRKIKKLMVSPMLPLILLFVVLACSEAAKLPPLAGDAVILAFGDSLTFGTGAPPGESYPALLEGMVGRRVVNAGIPGEVSGEGLARLPEVLKQERPALMILCHGGNDLLRRLDQRQTADHLRAMVRLAQERGVAVVLVAVPSPAISLSPPSFYREIAAETKVPITEQALPELLSQGSLRADLIHPNGAGYRKLAEALATFLAQNGAL